MPDCSSPLADSGSSIHTRFFTYQSRQQNRKTLAGHHLNDSSMNNEMISSIKPASGGHIGILAALIQKLSSSMEEVDHDTELSSQARSRMLDITRAISHLLQPPEDYIITTAFQINVLICIRTCSELGVFHLLHSVAPGSLSASEIAKKLNAEELLIVRFMRGVCSMNFATEVGKNTYTANNVTIAMSNPSLAGGFCLTFDNAARPKSNLWSHIECFRDNGYQSPSNALDSPYQRANECVGVTSFEHWMQTPDESLRFNNFMKMIRGSRPSWIEWMEFDDIKTILGTPCEDDVLLVDVAGGHGHDAEAFLHAYGDKFFGSIVLQDLPDVIRKIDPKSLSKRIIKQSHDFFSATTSTWCQGLLHAYDHA